MRHIIHCVRYAVRRPRIACLGVREFRTDFTTHFDGDELESYDSGRELAHIVTMRRFES